jgi:putative membrane protein
MKPSEQPPYNLSNELAKERTRAAADRTLMAWIRTSLSLIGFGFGIPTIVKTIEATSPGLQLNPQNVASIIGLSFIAIGIFAMAAALRDHRQILKRIQGDHYTYVSTKTAEKVGFALLLVGLIIFIGVLIKTIG